MNLRDFLTTAVVSGTLTTVGAPVFRRRAYAQNPIKIGLPAALSGSNAQYGIQAKRACELFAKENKGKGILGRPVEFIYEDTAGDPATAVRKAQKLVEKDGVKFLTGVALSSEALAVSAKCPEWKVIFMSTINGAGTLTTKSFHRYFFRVNTNPSDCAEATAQLFLGVRLQCAKCHHHPFEKYGQEDYYSFASYFARVGAKPSEEYFTFATLPPSVPVGMTASATASRLATVTEMVIC